MGVVGSKNELVRSKSMVTINIYIGLLMGKFECLYFFDYSSPHYFYFVVRLRAATT